MPFLRKGHSAWSSVEKPAKMDLTLNLLMLSFLLFLQEYTAYARVCVCVTCFPVYCFTGWVICADVWLLSSPSPCLSIFSLSSLVLQEGQITFTLTQSSPAAAPYNNLPTSCLSVLLSLGFALIWAHADQEKRDGSECIHLFSREEKQKGKERNETKD